MKDIFRFLLGCLFSFVLLLVGNAAVRAQVPDWQMVTAGVNDANAPSFSRTTGIAMDASGNVYTVGYFDGTISFGQHTLTSVGSTDIFIVKWSPVTRSYVYALQAGGSGRDFAVGIALSGASIYVCGTTTLGATFGGITIAPGSGSISNSNVYVAKLTDAGATANWTWVQQVQGSAEEYAGGIAVSGSSVYIEGTFLSPTIGLGPIVLTNTAPPSLPYNAFVAKLYDAGSSASFAWAKVIGGYAQAGTICTNATTVYVTGVGQNTTTFDNLTLYRPTSPGGFVAKLVDAGSSANWVWVESPVGFSGFSLFRVGALAPQGADLYLTGRFAGQVVLGNTTLTNPAMSANNMQSDLYVAKLTDAGATAAWQWGLNATGAGDDYGASVAVRGANVYATGSFNSQTLTLANQTLMLTPGPVRMGLAGDVFVAKLTDTGSSGRVDWARSAGGNLVDEGSGVGLGNGVVYVAGTSEPNPDARFGNYFIRGTAQETAFLASLADPILTATTAPLRTETTNLFPNPAHHRATIQLPALPGIPTATLTLLDALGRTLRTQTALTNANAELDLTGLAPGLYAVRVVAGASTATQRLVVE